MSQILKFVDLSEIRKSKYCQKKTLSLVQIGIINSTLGTKFWHNSFSSRGNL